MARKVPSLNAQAQAASAVNTLFGVSQGEQVASGLKLIKHDQIEVKAQPRTTFSAAEVSELASSIVQLRERNEGIEGTGILQPLLVRALASPNGSARYHLVAGERRYRASQEANLPFVPCLVVTMNDDAVLLAQLIENLQRQDLAPLEEAQAFQELQQEQSLSLREIAKAMGKTLGYVTNRLGLLKMGSDVQKMVFLRKNTLMHAQHIDAVADPAFRQKLIHSVVEEGASIKEVQRRIAAETTVSSATGSIASSATGLRLRVRLRIRVQLRIWLQIRPRQQRQIIPQKFPQPNLCKPARIKSSPLSSLKWKARSIS